MSFTTIDILAGVVAPFTTRFGGFDTLAVNNGSTGFRCTSFFYSFLLAQSFIDGRPTPVFGPFAKVVVDGSLWGIVMGQIPSLTTGAYAVENGIDDCPQVDLSWLSGANVARY